MRQDIRRARGLRRVQTEPERQLWNILRGRRFDGFKFRRQFPVGPYVADFVCLERRLIIEADGSQHAESSHDLHRDTWLRSQRFKILRIWNIDILKNRQEVGDAIWAALASDLA